MIFFWVFLTSLMLTWLVRHYAIHKSIIDIPNDRSSHTYPTPTGGGLAVAISWFLGLTYFFINGKIESSVFFALLAGLPLTLIGLADDIFSLKPNVRFLVQFICAAVALFFLKGLRILPLPWGPFEMTIILTTIALFGIVWATNLFNFLDGIDGYIGSEVVFIGLATYALTGDINGMLLTAVTLGFLLWNWQKAKIFIGDVGSTLLGFSIAVMAIYHQNNSISSIWVWLILTSVFWFDATVTLIRRFLNKEKLSEAHRKHAYQRIVQSGFSHQKTTVWSIVINLVGFGFAWLAHVYGTYAWLFLILDLGVLIVVLGYIDRRKPFEKHKIKAV